jgi:hypothetical protein
MSIFCLISAFYSPFILVFRMWEDVGFALNYFMDVLWLVHMALSFITIPVDLIKPSTHREVMKSYLKGNFCLDFICTVPPFILNRFGLLEISYYFYSMRMF